MKHLARILPVMIAVLFFVTTIEKKGSFDITESTAGSALNISGPSKGGDTPVVTGFAKSSGTHTAGSGAGKVILQD